MKIHFINSRNYWTNGWFLDTDILEIAVTILKQVGFELDVDEVSSVSELESILDKISADTLICSNAYHVNTPKGESLWLNDFIETRNLPFIASSSNTLKIALNKEECQITLANANVPIPSFLIIQQQQLSEIKNLIEFSELNFPLVLKPTSESSSIGIVTAQNLEQAVEKGTLILQKFPLGNLIIEEFLIGKEVTCASFQIGTEMLFVPTYYTLEGILDRKSRLDAWDNGGKEQLPLDDLSIQEQLQKYMPKITEVLDIKDVCRVDARTDKDGILRFFDINGFPGLAFPRSITVKQAFTCFPNYPKDDVYKAMIHTIVYGALLRYNLPIPTPLKDHNLLTLESNRVIRHSK